MLSKKDEITAKKALHFLKMSQQTFTALPDEALAALPGLALVERNVGGAIVDLELLLLGVDRKELP